MAAPVSDVRAFNRFYTRQIGLLEPRLDATEFTLTEGRVLFELAAQDEVEVARLREELQLDAGYLSRIIAKLEAAKLVTRARSGADARRALLRLTSEGRARFAALEASTTARMSGLLAPLGEGEREALVAAMRSIQRILSGRPERAQTAAPTTASRQIELRAPRPGELGWVVQRHGALYAEEHGWDHRFEALVAKIIGDYAAAHDADRERGWIATVDGAPAGCIFCMRRSEHVAQLRLLLVEPSARGLGLGARLVDACVAFARAAGYAELVLWTNDVLASARRLYQRAGFALVEQGPAPAFGKPLVEQTWRLAL